MNGSLQTLPLAFLAGIAIPLGRILTRVERIQPAWLETELRHPVMGFGGGAPIAAVALVLLPHVIGTRFFTLSTPTAVREHHYQKKVSGRTYS